MPVGGSPRGTLASASATTVVGASRKRCRLPASGALWAAGRAPVERSARFADLTVGTAPGLGCPVSDPPDPGLRVRIEEYYDVVPRTAARAEDFGALTLFVRDGEGWPYYARPTLGGAGAFEVEDVERVRARQRELGIPESFEWVAETTPALRSAVEASGLVVNEHPLMVLDVDAPATAVAPPGGRR